MTLIFAIVGLLISLALFAGAVVLQVFLSRKENKWLGLILPIVYFMLALIFTALLFLFSAEGEGVLVSSILVFLLANIPTIILLLIYFPNRKKHRRNEQLHKMNILDLD